MKHYISVEFLPIFIVSSHPAQTQSPPAEKQSAPSENFLATVLLYSLVRSGYNHRCASRRD